MGGDVQQKVIEVKPEVTVEVPKDNILTQTVTGIIVALVVALAMKGLGNVGRKRHSNKAK